MRDMIKNINQQVKSILEEKSLLPIKINKYNNKHITVPITKETIEYLINKRNLDGIKNLEVDIIGEKMIVTGVAKKLLLNINFKIDLIISRVVERRVYFEIIEMKPINHEWIKKNIFKDHPYINYNCSIIDINLNVIDYIRLIPIGNIYKCEIKDNKIWVSLGV